MQIPMLPTVRSGRLFLLVLLVQVLLTLIAFAASNSYNFEWDIVENVFSIKGRYSTQYWEIMAKIHGYDVGYLLRTGPSELRTFFPNYYWLIYGVGRFLKFGIPLIVILMPVRWAYAKRLQLSKVVSTAFYGLSIPSVFFTTLAISLLSYLVFRQFSPQPYAFQLSLSRSFLTINIVCAAMACILHRDRVFGRIKNFLFECSAPHSLAITRIIFFSYLIFLYVVAYLLGAAPSIGELDKTSLPGIGWLIDILPVNESLYSWICYFGAFFSFMVVLGYRTRLFLILNAIAVFYVVATPNFFGKLWHEQLVIWIAWIMACSPCADVLSLDSRKDPLPTVASKPHYGFHLKVIWLHFGLIYFFAGFYKLWLCGFDWALSGSMINQVQIEWFEHFDRIPGIRIDRFPTFLKIGGLGVILFEMTYIFLLFGRRSRWLAVFGGLAMHNFLGYIMYISFLSKLQVFYIVFIPWNKLLARWGKIKGGISTHYQIPDLRSMAYIVPLFILSMNVLCGIFNISSYPFSIYPVYAEIVPDNVKYFEYRPLDVGSSEMDVREEGKKHGFEWENYSRTEYHIIRMWEADLERDSAGVRTLWKRWQLQVPTLATIDSVDVYVVERPLVPERKNERLSEKYLMTISGE